jgi:hypothetical protein
MNMVIERKNLLGGFKRKHLRRTDMEQMTAFGESIKEISLNKHGVEFVLN